MTRVLSKHPEFIHHTTSLDAVLRGNDGESADSRLRETESEIKLPSTVVEIREAGVGSEEGAEGGFEAGGSSRVTQVLAGGFVCYKSSVI